ncbi:hypothetical protein [Tautonia marina]|uniref:hypothetical protein n=1 Tax=Tautonia marina TaxID=2653855 RepID=UPI00126102F1|nr:hypothetical protein [Tautonia marina]
MTMTTPPNDPHSPTPSETPGSGAPPSAPDSGDRRAGGGPALLPLWALLAALAAGAASWALGETKLVQVPAREVPMETMGVEHMGTTAQTEQRAVLETAMRAYGVTGALLGLMLGLAGGLARASRHDVLRSAIVGLVVGAVAGALASLAAVPAFFHFRDSITIDDLLLSWMMHGLIWGAIGSAGGLALAIGSGGGGPRIARGVAGGLMGALIGALILEFVGAVLFANDETGEPLAASAQARLMLLLFGVSITALVAAVRIQATGAATRKPAAH